MGPLNNRMPRWCQFKWGEMHGAFERKRSEKTSMSDKERKKAEHKNEKMLKKLSLKDQG